MVLCNGMSVKSGGFKEVNDIVLTIEGKGSPGKKRCPFQ